MLTRTAAIRSTRISFGNSRGGHMVCRCSALLGAALVLAGCKKSPSTAVPPRPTPAESFKLIVQSFSRQLGADLGGATPEVFSRGDGSGITAVVVSNSVNHEMIPPAAQGEPYRATITLTTRSRVSRFPAGSDSKSNRDNQSGDETVDPETGILDTDTEILDPGLVGSSGNSRGSRRSARGAKADVSPIRRADDDVQKFELVYRNDHWVLLTEVDAKQQSVRRAFDRALKTQL